jgi:hypothetical protein
MADSRNGEHSAAAQEADATDEVTRNTKSQTTAASYTTTDHDEIRAWAEARGGRPASIRGTEDGSGGGVLRIDFDPADEDRLTEESWDEFFAVFDDRKLAFVYQEQTSDGNISRFNKLVSR